jgi:hypothetical protein
MPNALGLDIHKGLPDVPSVRDGETVEDPAFEAARNGRTLGLGNPSKAAPNSERPLATDNPASSHTPSPTSSEGSTGKLTKRPPQPISDWAETRSLPPSARNKIRKPRPPSSSDSASRTSKSGSDVSSLSDKARATLFYARSLDGGAVSLRRKFTTALRNVWARLNPAAKGRYARTGSLEPEVPRPAMRANVASSARKELPAKTIEGARQNGREMAEVGPSSSDQLRATIIAAADQNKRDAAKAGPSSSDQLRAKIIAAADQNRRNAAEAGPSPHE